MKDGKQHIVVAIPTMHRRITDSILDFMLGMWELNARSDSPWYFDMIRTSNLTYIEAARNRLVRMFLEMPTADRMFFIDSDTLPTPDSFRMLMVKDAPIIAGVYPIIKVDKDNATQPIITSIWREYRRRESDGVMTYKPLVFEELDGKPHEVDAVATGSMIIDRAVLEDPRMCTGVDPDGTRAVFNWPRWPSGASICSDDVDFCQRARANGWKVVAHTGVIWGHDKPVDLKWIMEQLVIAYWSGAENEQKVAEMEKVSASA